MKRIVILTGAGISAESGIPVFRGSDGLWEGHRVEEVATPEGFAANPALVRRFYNERRRAVLTKEPNAAHRALARLRREFPGEVLLVTQNIDDLHERGGSPDVLHMHGELLKARCVACGGVSAWREDLDEAAVCPVCHQAGKLRPHVVWFGEMPLELERIFDALARADVFAAIGTSGQVYPAAGFVEVAREAGAATVEMNLETTGASPAFQEHRAGPASVIVPAWVEELLAAGG